MRRRAYENVSGIDKIIDFKQDKKSDNIVEYRIDIVWNFKITLIIKGGYTAFELLLQKLNIEFILMRRFYVDGQEIKCYNYSIYTE